jgi:hypothetical protein
VTETVGMTGLSVFLILMRWLTSFADAGVSPVMTPGALKSVSGTVRFLAMEETE